ncbi:hypothetical protein MKY04_04350 [Lysinibacillus telephonicus]|uniref:hypothetical protein n=1 Tax=Lysinibacillus telephonicus TaxID=1714840 RepID=UPI0031FC1937
MTKEQAIKELFGLISFYQENRDLPIPNDFNFQDEVKKCCDILEVDLAIIRNQFNLY